jgi:c-di-AMP phosphodiesterase-like protein
MQNKKFDWLTRLEEIPSRIYVFMAIAMLAIDTAICAFTNADPAIVGIITISVYTVASLVVYFLVQRRLNLYRLESNASEAQTKGVIHSFKNQLRIPYAVVSEQGKIITVNAAFSSATNTNGTIYNKDINELCSINLEKIIESVTPESIVGSEELQLSPTSLRDVKESEIATIGDMRYKVECYPVSSKGKTYYMLVFRDITELLEINQRYRNHYTAVGYIVIDNLEEIAQYVKVNYQDETREVGKLLDDWVSSMGGILREYEANKFLLIFNNEMLSECIRDKFSILSSIHKIEIGDAKIPLTISMGIATVGDTLEEREHNAMVSLDMALQRGGDQVVLKTPTGLFYFGAKTKTLQKRTKGHAKIIFGKLAALIEGSSNVIVMGHRNPDFDSIGACVGMATLIKNMFKGIDIKIVADTENENFKACTSRLLMLADYKDIFIDRVSALEYNNTETLLIIVDANNMAILESPELAKNSFKKVIIDHHIKKEEFDDEPEFAYIDPSASSASELIAEMLEEVLPPEISFKEEANVMMSGIMLDTKNFTRTVGMRTFAAALYLKNSGADTEYARTFFEEAFEDYLSESQFGSGAKIYRGRIAIATSTGSGSSNDRILAAKAADKLLSVRDVNAAFTLILTGETVNVSARSDGSINVQLILEQVGGGGHFDAAGAAFEECTLEEAELKLTAAIDNYLDNLAAEKNNE